MAINVGGREYYTDAQTLGAGGGDSSPKCRGIFCGSNDSHTFTFASGNTLRFTPEANSIVPFAPAGVTTAGSTPYQLF